GARWLRVLPSGGIGGVVPGDRMTCEVDVQIAGAAGGRESDLRAQGAEHQLSTEDRDEERPADAPGAEPRMRLLGRSIAQAHPAHRRPYLLLAQDFERAIPQASEEPSETVAGMDLEVVIPGHPVGRHRVHPTTHEALPQDAVLQPHEADQLAFANRT